MNVKYKIKSVDGLVIPSKANPSDAGYDVIATSDPKIVGDKYYEDLWNSNLYVEYETGLYISPDVNIQYSSFGPDQVWFHTDLQPRSSISKYNLILANSIGLIDRGYKHQVLARFKYIFQPCDLRVRDDSIYGKVDLSKVYKKGDKIAQILPRMTHTISFREVPNLDGEDRGGGFGSTGA